MSGLGIVGAGLLLGLFYAPSVSSNEWNAPEAYRIIFWHVPTAWTSFLTFGMLFIGSLLWMWKRKEWAWQLSGVAAELSLLYGLCSYFWSNLGYGRVGDTLGLGGCKIEYICSTIGTSTILGDV